MKFPEFSRFSGPCEQSYPYNNKVMNHLCSHFGTFLAKLQNILSKEHGDIGTTVAAVTYMSARRVFQTAS